MVHGMGLNKMKFTKNQKIIIIIGVALVIASLLIPFISGLFGENSNLQSTGKKVSCETTIRNPVLTDEYRFEKVECSSKPSLLCGIPLSVSGLSLFRQADSVKMTISSSNVLSKSVNFQIDEGIITGTLKDVAINLCIPDINDRISLKLADADNQQTDSREVMV